VQVFEKHQLLIPLLIEFALENESGKVDDKEMALLCRTLGGLAAQLECEEMTIKNVSLYNKPSWVTDKVSEKKCLEFLYLLQVFVLLLLLFCSSHGVLHWNYRKIYLICVDLW